MPAHGVGVESQAPAELVGVEAVVLAAQLVDDPRTARVREGPVHGVRSSVIFTISLGYCVEGMRVNP